MREYELTYIIQPDAADERIEEIHQKVASAITGGQGKILLRDDWGRRRLAYEIQKFQKGDYFLLTLLGDGKFIPELERILRIDADVLRYMAICVDRDVKDIDARVEQATKEAAERALRRAERERQEAERLEQERIAAEDAAALALGAADPEDESEDGMLPGSLLDREDALGDPDEALESPLEDDED